MDTNEEYIDRIVDEQSLTAYLEDQLGTVNKYTIEHHQEGHSNETLFVTWGDRELVIRRPPPGEVAESAHDVLREYRVIDALQDTNVRVPTTVLACDDHSVLGSDFYVMELIAGDVLRDDEPERFATPEYRYRIGTELVDALAEIHAVDYEAVDLGAGDFGYPNGFTQRQVDRWKKQIDWASEVTASERDVPALEDVTEWLQDNVPEDPPATLVHGDYKLDNVLFGLGTPPKITGIFDWELSTLGDPFTDLGWMLSFWHDADNSEPAIPELYPTFMTQEGYPTRQELVVHYEDATGYAFEHDRFYRTLAVYKMAGLGEMFFRRHLEGNADDPLYPLMNDGVPRLADRAMRIINEEEPL